MEEQLYLAHRDFLRIISIGSHIYISAHYMVGINSFITVLHLSFFTNIFFPPGTKITKSGKNVMLTETTGVVHKIPQPSGHHNLPEQLQPIYLHFKQVFINMNNPWILHSRDADNVSM